ncbi:MAG TPA: hypothetical protein VF082_09390 [Jiangellaceae bacterium]
MTIASGEPTGSFYDDVRGLPAALAELGTAHVRAAALAAELDLDHTGLWEHADDIVAELSTEAYYVAGVVTGEPATSAAVRVAPIVRLRELAVAQSRLLAALTAAAPSERSTGALLTAADRSARRVRMLGGRLQHALRSAQWVGSIDEERAIVPAIRGDG